MRAALLALVLLVAAPAFANGTGSGTGGAAAAHFRAGSEHYAQGDFRGALAEFQTGYRLMPSPAFLVNIGQCLRKLDRLDEAVLAYRRFLDSHTGSPKLRLDVFEAFEDTLGELNRRIDQLAADAARFRAFLASNQGDTHLRAEVQTTLDDVMRTLVHIDDTLNGGYGVGRSVALPQGGPNGPDSMAHAAGNVHKQLEAMRTRH
jgi:tetratricopeptide (TPR) repeat protein